MQGSDAPGAHEQATGGSTSDPPGKPDCVETRRHLMMFLDGECTAVVTQELTSHLRHCPPCMQRAEFERHVRTMIAVRCRESAPPSLLQRILLRLQES